MRDIFTVNWTLFLSFDKNIEFAIECKYSVLCDACCVEEKGVQACNGHKTFG
jgi:hypothetical protein